MCIYTYSAAMNRCNEVGDYQDTAQLTKRRRIERVSYFLYFKSAHMFCFL